MEEIRLKPIGIIHTPYKTPKDCPKQGFMSHGVSASIELLPEFKEGLLDLDGFSHIVLIWVFSKSEKGHELFSTPPGENRPYGVFATRSPFRPNPIGLTTVRLISMENNILYIENPDMVDGTPLLDIKPYVLRPETLGEIRRGWLDKRK